MPPDKHLTGEQIADLTTWIKDGAAWPKVSIPLSIGKPNPEIEKRRRTHWAWQPLRSVKAPAVRDMAWGFDDVDRFILARLEEKGLKPVGDADRVTLLRRVTFDLTGLPPTPEQIEAFVADSAAQPQAALEKVVDRLLASPAFGERWGRHWLDVARYGESTGSARNLPYPHAWRYRDYVLDAFNNDKPYDQFLREQVAGDLLPAETPREKDEHLIATGFLALGVKDVNQRFKVRFIMDNIDEQIDTVTRSVLALTASCCAVPRSQVRSDTDDRLLRPGRHLPEQRPVRRCAQQNGRRRLGLLRSVAAPFRWVGDGPRPQRDGKDRAGPRGTGRGPRRTDGAERRFEEERRRSRARRKTGCGPQTGQPIASRAARSDRSRGKGARGDGGARFAEHRRHRGSHPRRSGDARPGCSPRLPLGGRCAERPENQPEPERPSGIGPVVDHPSEPADAARDGQSRLASSVRAGPGKQRGQLRRYWREAVPSGAARSPGNEVRPRRLVREEAGAVAGTESGVSTRS